MSGLRESQHLKIQLKEIELATKNFETCIGKCGYGLVYKGELSISGKLMTVAVKRLNEQFGQGLKEFLTEIQLLTGQNHPNLISLLGYCDEGKEKIIVYEYAERGSLDRYLTSSNANYTLTWLERLKICVDAAQGLDHLHNHAGKHQTIIHRDIKSANILVDQNWVAKISDLGLSKLSLAGLDRSAVISHPCGTLGYCEQEYIDTGIVKKESDVYSFGMVLFEVLCGRLCTIRHQDGSLLTSRLAKDYYRKKKLIEIIDPGLREQMSFESMNKFSAIAYGCVQEDRGHRPGMDLVVKELVESLEIQVEYESAKTISSRVVEYESAIPKSSRVVEYESAIPESSRVVKHESAKPESSRMEEFDSDEDWEMKLPQDSEDIIKMLSPGVIYTSKKELFSLLHQGILFDNKERFFWINDDGKKCESISAKRFLEAMNPKWLFQLDLRFSRVAEFSYKNFHEIKFQIKTSMLSLGTMYAASLVFRRRGKPKDNLSPTRLMTIKWKTEDLSVYSTHAAELTTGNWYKIKMWHFINHVSDADFDIVIEEFSYFEDPTKFKYLLIQGIEFQPIDIIQHEEIEGFESLSTTEEEDIVEDAYWEKKLPKDHQHYIQLSDKPLSFTSKKELYYLLCAGFLAHNGGLWFSLCKSTGGICSMLPSSEVCDSYEGKANTLSLSESRFSKAKKLQNAWWQGLTCILQSSMFSPKHIYACYLVFKFSDNNIRLYETRLFQALYRLEENKPSTNSVHLNMYPPINIPTIKPKNDYGLHDSSHIPKIEGLWMPKGRVDHATDGYMEQRKDGWMEVMLCKSLQQLEGYSSLEVILKSKDENFYGIIVEGVEFRPM